MEITTPPLGLVPVVPSLVRYGSAQAREPPRQAGWRGDCSPVCLIAERSSYVGEGAGRLAFRWRMDTVAFRRDTLSRMPIDSNDVQSELPP